MVRVPPLVTFQRPSASACQVVRNGDVLRALMSPVLLLWRQIEDTHPLRKVRTQAANLRFILQAPKLKRGPDEVIKLPILELEERKKCVVCFSYD